MNNATKKLFELCKTYQSEVMAKENEKALLLFDTVFAKYIEIIKDSDISWVYKGMNRHIPDSYIFCAVYLGDEVFTLTICEEGKLFQTGTSPPYNERFIFKIESPEALILNLENYVRIKIINSQLKKEQASTNPWWQKLFA